MIDSDSDALSGVGSDEEARPLNTAEEQAAKRAKLPVVNPFDLMQERRMSSHRTSATRLVGPSQLLSASRTTSFASATCFLLWAAT